MGARLPKIGPVSTPHSADQATSMPTFEEMATDDASDYSEELGMDYLRIEYPRDVYDRACGRSPAKSPPLPMKRKVNDWLNDSQSSQTDTRKENEVPSSGRKNKKMRVAQAGKMLAAVKKKKTAKKVGEKRTVGDYMPTMDEESSSDETDTDEDDVYAKFKSEVGSSPKKKKKRNVDSQMHRARSVNDKEELRKIKRRADMQEIRRFIARDDEPIYKKPHSNRIEKRDKNHKKRDKEHRRDSYVEEKHKKVIREIKMEDISDEVDINEKKEMDKKSEKKVESIDSRKEVHSNEKKLYVETEKKKKDRKDSSSQEKKSSDSSQEVPPIRKSVMKTSSSSTTSPSAASVLPQVVQDLFNATAPAASSLAAFRVPKKKKETDAAKSEAASDRSNEKAAAVETSDGSFGWDPRDTAFVPPKRSFGKPSPVGPMMGAGERWKNGQRPIEGRPFAVPAPPSNSRCSLNSSEERMSQAESDEGEAKKTAAQPGKPPLDSTMPPMLVPKSILKKPTNRGLGTARLSGSFDAALTASTMGDTRQVKWTHNTPAAGKGGTTVAAMGHAHKSDHLKSAKRSDKHAREPQHPNWMSAEWSRDRGSSWNEATPHSAAESRGHSSSLMTADTPTSPPHSGSAFNGLSIPLPTHFSTGTVRAPYRFIPIDEDCLPDWNNSKVKVKKENDKEEEEERPPRPAAAAAAAAVSTHRTPLLPTPTSTAPDAKSSRAHCSTLQPVPHPSQVSLLDALRTTQQNKSATVSAHPPPHTTHHVSPHHPALFADVQASKEPNFSAPVAVPAESADVRSVARSSSSSSSRFGPMAAARIPPPGLVDATQLRLAGGADEPSLRSLASLLNLPKCMGLAPPIPAPTHLVPALPYPDLPAIQHHFFPAPPVQMTSRADPRRRSGERLQQQQPQQRTVHQRTVDPSTLPKLLEAFLPKNAGQMGGNDENEVVLYVRPMDDQPTNWNAVREHFKDADCFTCVYGDVLSLRYTGVSAREKAQLVIIRAPHVVNGQQLIVGLTYSVLFEASQGVAKSRLYQALMDKFGSVVEVEKKRDSPAGQPVYKIYFSALDKAQAAASEGITTGEFTLTNIGRVPM